LADPNLVQNGTLTPHRGRSQQGISLGMGKHNGIVMMLPDRARSSVMPLEIGTFVKHRICMEASQPAAMAGSVFLLHGFTQ